MRSGKTPPYIRLKRTSIRCSNWRRAGRGDLEDQGLIEDWDQNLVFTVTRTVEIDSSIAAEAGLRSGARLILMPTWWSNGTYLRGRGEAQEFVVDSELGRKTYSVALTLEGVNLARNVELRLALVLAAPTDEMLKDRLIVHRPGSVLWDDCIRLRLEGEAPRFPISVVDFSENRIGPIGACWRFEWNSVDPTLPAMATMRLFVNSRQKAFYNAITSQDPTPTQVAIRSALKHAIGFEMLHLAIGHADELEQSRGEFMPDSAGHVMLDLVDRIFPGLGPVACAEFRKQRFGEFSAEVQSKLAVFSDKILLEGLL